MPAAACASLRSGATAADVEAIGRAFQEIERDAPAQLPLRMTLSTRSIACSVSCRSFIVQVATVLGTASGRSIVLRGGTHLAGQAEEGPLDHHAGAVFGGAFDRLRDLRVGVVELEAEDDRFALAFAQRLEGCLV